MGAPVLCVGAIVCGCIVVVGGDYLNFLAMEAGTASR